jgi:MoxR-like ATPase
MLDSITAIEKALTENHYVTDRPLATVLYLARMMQKPVLLEGEPGVGKTEVAKVLAKVYDTRLIRLQCYEGLDVHSALYEWNYARQILEIRIGEMSRKPTDEVKKDIFSQEFLLKRPLLEAIASDSSSPPVLLIDEIDRSDEEFEAFLLEILSDFQVTIPEIGTITARHQPHIVLTSNRTREIHDALRRRCLYHWIDYPSFEKELKIINIKVPGIKDKLAEQVCAFMQLLREEDFYKKPGVSETLDWAMALIALHRDELDEEILRTTLGCLFKNNEDMNKFLHQDMERLLSEIRSG